MNANITAPGRKRMPLFGAFCVGLGLVGLGACDADSTAPEGVGSIQILLTDAPADMLDSAHVWISQVYLVGGGDSTEPDTADVETEDAASGRVDLFNDPANPLVFDLLQLRDGVTGDLTGLVSVDPRAYRGLRFVIDSARVTLTDDHRFESGVRQETLTIPSGSTSGIKVKIKDILEVSEGDALTVVVDLDVDENFVIQTNQQTGDVRSVRFKPVLREAERTRQR